MNGCGEADNNGNSKGFGDRLDLVRKGEMFIEYQAEVSSRLSGVK